MSAQRPRPGRPYTRGEIILPLVGLLLVVTLLRFGIWLNPELKEWLKPQPVLSLVGLVIGFMVLSWQLHRQHENALETNRRQSQDRLKLELYGRPAERIEATRVPPAEVGILPTAFVGELVVRSGSGLNGGGVSKGTHLTRLRAAHSGAHHALIQLMSVLETHEIVMHEFSVFRDSLSKALQAITVASNDFNQVAFAFADSEDGKPLRWPPSSEDLRALSSLASSVQSAALDAVGVVWDLRVEAQNHLLGELFGRRVPARAPGDATVLVTKIGGARKQ